MNEIISLVVNETSDECAITSHESKANRAEGIMEQKGRRICLREEAF